METVTSLFWGDILSGSIRNAKYVRFGASSSSSTARSNSVTTWWPLITWGGCASDWQVWLGIALPEAHCTSSTSTNKDCTKVSPQLINKMVETFWHSLIGIIAYFSIILEARYWCMFTKGIHCRVSIDTIDLIPLMDISINTQSTSWSLLSRHYINTYSTVGW